VKASDLGNLAADLPTTPQDVASLRRALRDSALQPRQLVALLAQVPGPTPAELRSRPGPRGEPFELPRD